MPGSFFGIDLASRALRAFQRQLDVTGHNIANVNTPGYSRQVVDLTQIDGTPIAGVHPFTLGNGVTVDNVNRVRDMLLDLRRTGEGSAMGRFTSLAGSLRGVQSIYNEPGPNGIADALDRFFNSWSALASNPGTPGAREAVQSAALTLTQRVRGNFTDMQRVATDTKLSIDETLKSVDALATKIADLNIEIKRRSASGDRPNDLLDQRDQAVQDLAGLVDIATSQRSDGTITIYVNQFALVDGTGSRPIPKTYDAATSTLTDGTLTYDVRSGALKGQFDTLNDISSYSAQLDTLANTLRTGINTLHATGVNENGTTGINFFNDALPQTGAIDFDLDAAIKGDSKNIAAGTSGAEGDGGLALSISRLRDDTTIAGLGGRTFGQYYGELVTTVGRDLSTSETQMDTQSLVLQQIDLQRQSVSGVSLDDEMANMLRFQRSYQAAAKALSVFDQVTEDLINMLRR